jgi:hypothetical protein
MAGPGFNLSPEPPPPGGYRNNPPPGKLTNAQMQYVVNKQREYNERASLDMKEQHYYHVRDKIYVRGCILCGQESRAGRNEK